MPPATLRRPGSAAQVTRVVAVDWSGRASGERRHLWVAEVADGRPAGLAPASRQEVAALLLDRAEADPRLVVGLDFAFSFPLWFLDAQGAAGPAELWADQGRLERWLDDCPAPFWGRPGVRRPGGVEQLRVTERAAGRLVAPAGRPPKSVFQIGGAGAVGTGSLRGMPLLHLLRRTGFSLWPFDAPALPMVVEVWPRLHYGGPLVKSAAAARDRLARSRLPGVWRAAAAASEDAFDAAVTAWDLWDRRAELGSAGAGAAADPVVSREGWIWGVPQ
jgi:hypothetical protein